MFRISVRLCTKSSCSGISLCNLCVLCVSVVDEFRAKTYHRDTENTEIAQRNQCVETGPTPANPALLQEFEIILGSGQYRER